jgi:tetratricopeptide (TPR) repeat protein
LGFQFSSEAYRNLICGLLGGDEKVQFSLKLGRYLLAKTDSKDLEASIYKILDYYNYGAELILNDDNAAQEKAVLVNLNQTAGFKAKRFAAFDVATRYLAKSLDMLQGRQSKNDAWTNNYELMLPTVLALSDLYYSIGDFENAEKCYQDVFDQGRTVLDKLSATPVMCKQYLSQTRYKELVQILPERLEMLNIRFSMSECAALKERTLIEKSSIDVYELQKTYKENWIDHSLDSVSDPTEVLTIELLGSLLSCFWLLRDYEYLYLVSVKMVRTFLRTLKMFARLADAFVILAAM